MNWNYSYASFVVPWTLQIYVWYSVLQCLSLERIWLHSYNLQKISLKREIGFRFQGFIIESRVVNNRTSREILPVINFQVGLTCFFSNWITYSTPGHSTIFVCNISRIKNKSVREDFVSKIHMKLESIFTNVQKSDVSPFSKTAVHLITIHLM
jgi:hypothetical protein